MTEEDKKRSKELRNLRAVVAAAVPREDSASEVSQPTSLQKTKA